jgi:hypothetical protein
MAEVQAELETQVAQSAQMAVLVVAEQVIILLLELTLVVLQLLVKEMMAVQVQLLQQNHLLAAAGVLRLSVAMQLVMPLATAVMV